MRLSRAILALVTYIYSQPFLGKQYEMGPSFIALKLLVLKLLPRRMRLNPPEEHSSLRTEMQLRSSPKKMDNFCEVSSLTYLIVPLSLTKNMQGHNCVWHKQLPSWVTSGNFDNATLQSIVRTHCSTIVGHYKDQM